MIYRLFIFCVQKYVKKIELHTSIQLVCKLTNAKTKNFR